MKKKVTGACMDACNFSFNQIKKKGTWRGSLMWCMMLVGFAGS